MAMNPAHRYVQLGLKSLGFDPGEIDGWWGPATALAARALFTDGPQKSSDWAIMMLRRGLSDLGYLEGLDHGPYDRDAQQALGALLDADGLPRASVAAHADNLEWEKPAFTPLQTTQKLYQGSGRHLIDTYCLHCGALPGGWSMAKSNQEMLQAVHRMHTLPKSRGGRGWSDTGYQFITFPDGETLPARPLNRVGAGAVGYNRGVIHHLMIEVKTINRTRLPEDYFTADTLAGAKAHLAEMSGRTPLSRLMGHREVAAKLCPGFDVIDADWTDLPVT